MPRMEFLVVAGILLVFAGGQWYATSPGPGETNRAVLRVVFGARATRRTGWFKTDDDGVYVRQRSLAYVYLVVAGICAWIGVLSLILG